MLCDRDLALFATAMYGYPGQESVKWDFYQPDEPARPVCAGVKYVGSDTVVALRGSVTGFDWLYNVAALPIDAGPLGPVHGGFYAGVPETWAWLKPLIRGKLFLAGHSRAGGQTPLLAGVAKADGLVPARYACFGPARCGMARLEDYLSDIPGRLYRAVAGGFHDPVTDVPFPLHDLPYVHVRPLIDLNVTISAAAKKDMGPFAIHYAPDYVAAM